MGLQCTPSYLFMHVCSSRARLIIMRCMNLYKPSVQKHAMVQRSSPHQVHNQLCLHPAACVCAFYAFGQIQMDSTGLHSIRRRSCAQVTVSVCKYAGCAKPRQASTSGWGHPASYTPLPGEYGASTPPAPQPSAQSPMPTPRHQAPGQDSVSLLVQRCSLLVHILLSSKLASGSCCMARFDMTSVMKQSASLHGVVHGLRCMRFWL